MDENAADNMARKGDIFENKNNVSFLTFIFVFPSLTILLIAFHLNSIIFTKSFEDVSLFK